jgi:hypothetical protein
MNQAIEVLSPNRVISKQTVRWLVGVQLVMLFFIWVFSPTVFLPKPKEVWQALGEMWMEGLGGELITSLSPIWLLSFCSPFAPHSPLQLLPSAAVAERSPCTAQRSGGGAHHSRDRLKPGRFFIMH